jgi:hypothetical protein
MKYSTIFLIILGIVFLFVIGIITYNIGYNSCERDINQTKVNLDLKEARLNQMKDELDNQEKNNK